MFGESTDTWKTRKDFPPTHNFFYYYNGTIYFKVGTNLKIGVQINSDKL